MATTTTVNSSNPRKENEKESLVVVMTAVKMWKNSNQRTRTANDADRVRAANGENSGKLYAYHRRSITREKRSQSFNTISAPFAIVLHNLFCKPDKTLWRDSRQVTTAVGMISRCSAAANSVGCHFRGMTAVVRCCYCRASIRRVITRLRSLSERRNSSILLME